MIICQITSVAPSAQNYRQGCRCENCVSANREYHRQWRRDHPHRVSAAQERYKRTYPDRVRNSQHKSEQKRKAHKAAIRKLWLSRNPIKAALYRERSRAYRAVWDKQRRKTPRGRAVRRAAWKAYKARKRGAIGRTSADQWQSRWDYYAGRCYLCGISAQGMDHVIPLKHGGTHWPANLRPCCNRCNGRKGAKTLSEYRCFLARLPQ